MRSLNGFEPTWESLEQFEVPEWYMDAKFGIFIHWGVYSVPAFSNEWYARNMYLEGSKEFEHHIKTFGPHTEFGYKDFIPQFTMEQYDPAAWAELFEKSGAKYVVPVAEHHDGFALYDTDLSDWCASKVGPKRDILGDLAAEVRRRDMVFGVSSHRAEHWWFMDGGRKFPSDAQDPAYGGLYGPAVTASPDMGSPEWHDDDWKPRPNAKFLDDWLARCTELVDKYQPQVFWFDWWIHQAVFEPYLQKFTAYYYNRGLEWGKGVAVTYKHNSYPDGTGVYDIERGQLNSMGDLFWQNDTSVSKNSWCYVENQDYKSTGHLVRDLIDIVSKNGCLLLNIGPRPDGTIPEPEQQILLEIGEWLALNGEAIYATRPWDTFGEGPTEIASGYFSDNERAEFTPQDFRFTRHGKTLYAICMVWPEDEAVITLMGPESSASADQIAEISLLGSAGALDWAQNEAGLIIKTPSEKPCDHAFTFKITLK
jgi:alpha-L-fucosidase